MATYRFKLFCDCCLYLFRFQTLTRPCIFSTKNNSKSSLHSVFLFNLRVIRDLPRGCCFKLLATCGSKYKYEPSLNIHLTTDYLSQYLDGTLLHPLQSSLTPYQVSQLKRQTYAFHPYNLSQWREFFYPQSSSGSLKMVIKK